MKSKFVHNRNSLSLGAMATLAVEEDSDPEEQSTNSSGVPLVEDDPGGATDTNKLIVLPTPDPDPVEDPVEEPVDSQNGTTSKSGKKSNGKSGTGKKSGKSNGGNGGSGGGGGGIKSLYAKHKKKVWIGGGVTGLLILISFFK